MILCRTNLYAVCTYLFFSGYDILALMAGLKETNEISKKGLAIYDAIM